MSLNLHIRPLSDWNLPQHKTLVIAGPCSVESEEQIHATALALACQHVSALRGGIWKPRTRPNTFTGIGREGLRWLAEAGKNAGLPSAVEVANARHVEDSLHAGIDMLWIGARSTVSPFTVQEIADALSGTDIPVMVKNPINPDLDLWIGALERLNQAGITRLMAVHRGFSSYDKNTYRNKPNWNIPLELKRLLPALPLICDPSHISGTADLVFHVAQKALDLNFDGLMIEAHIDPASALSDKEQQLMPEQVGELIRNLVVRNEFSDNPEFLNKLQQLRSSIDKVDYEVLELLANRMRLVAEIGAYKKENNITIFQPERWAEVVRTRLGYGREIHLSEDLILDLVRIIHRESIMIQTRVMNKD